MREIGTGIDFADASYKSCITNDDNLTIYLNSWDEKIIKIEFVNTLQFIYRGGSFIKGVYETNTEKTFLLEALSSYYEKIPEEHPFKIFSIVDVDDCSFFEIVAEKVSISKE